MRKNAHKRRRPLKRRDLPDTFKSGFLAELDQRSSLARRLRETFEAIVEEIGGPEQLTETKIGLIEQYVFQREFQRTIAIKIAADPIGQLDLISKWTQQNNALNGLASKIGLERREPQDFNALDVLDYDSERIAS